MKYFIDSSVIINLLDSKINDDDKEKIKDENNEFFINRLVRVECLRTISLENTKIYKESEKVLDGFIQVDITPKIYNQAIELSRECKNKGITLKGNCEAIDFVHFITAKVYKLEMLSNDKDFIKLDKIWEEKIKRISIQ